MHLSIIIPCREAQKTGVTPGVKAESWHRSAQRDSWQIVSRIDRKAMFFIAWMRSLDSACNPDPTKRSAEYRRFPKTSMVHFRKRLHPEKHAQSPNA